MANIRMGSVSLDCGDPHVLADFWAGLLSGDVVFASDDFVAVKIPTMWISAVRVDGYTPPTWPEGGIAKQIHLDLAVDDLASGVTQALELGAVRADFQPAPERYVVLFDPAGHPFCLTTQIPD
ncbi:MAG: VOC family protein [Acidobacteria bacterium]|nr:VOC family protein [Acidobacteriota bacterium]